MIETQDQQETQQKQQPEQQVDAQVVQQETNSQKIETDLKPKTIESKNEQKPPDQPIPCFKNVLPFPPQFAPPNFPTFQQQPPMFGAPQSFSNNYGKVLQVNQEQFDDDEPIVPQSFEAGKQKANYDLFQNLSLQVLSQYQKGKLLKIHQYLPGVVSIKTNDILPENLDKEQQNRVGVDLLCLIDKSGSMQGQKIEMVKQSLNSLLDFLTPNDRLQLISFDSNAQRLTSLKKVTDENKQQFKAVIAQLYADGGTTISNATRLALQQLEQRKYRNNVTSIFLLSDGQDGGAEYKFQKQLEKTVEEFTLHSFGFGNDHDAQLMTKMCALKNGSFYFVSNIGLLDEFYADALGGLISVVGKELEIKVRCQPDQPYDKIKIHKTYGQMWKNNGQEYIIKLPQIASGSRKDYVFELQLPEFDQVIGDEQRLSKVMEVQLKITDALTGQVIEKNASLELTFFNENEIINDNEENIEVAAQYYRVKGTEIMDDARRACDRGDHEEAQSKIDAIVQKIQSNKAVSSRATEILDDLKQAKQASIKSNYRSYGQQQMFQMAHNTCAQQGVNAQFNMIGMQMPQQGRATNQNMAQFRMMNYVQISKQSPNQYPGQK